ncbi:hypothetical protein BT69DRAFT_1316474 [Atractiella rhizophila]|nr:hypothetical protein BT69DRAFT_1316474 [Atractiella rhizophila]
MVDCISLKRVKQLTTLVSEVVLDSTTYIAKFAHFEWEIPQVEQETQAAYQLLEGCKFIPQFIAHIHEDGCVIGFLLEKLVGHAASIEDLDACQAILKKLHALGLLHGDVNRNNFVVLSERRGIKLIDFEHFLQYPNPKQMQEELEKVPIELIDNSGRGGGWQWFKARGLVKPSLDLVVQKAVMDNQLSILATDIDGDGVEDPTIASEYHVQIGQKIKYLTIQPRTFDRAMLSWLIQSLPSLPIDKEWNIADISRDQSTRNLNVVTSNKQLTGILPWHHKMVHCISLKRVKQLTTLVSKVVLDSTTYIAKFAHFEWEILEVEQETRAYQLLEGCEFIPRFIAHIHVRADTMCGRR